MLKTTENQLSVEARLKRLLKINSKIGVLEAMELRQQVFQTYSKMEDVKKRYDAQIQKKD